MSHEHRVHTANYYRGPHIADGWHVWCTAGDLELQATDQAHAQRLADRHHAEHQDAA
jgi:hypothetical protein